MRRETLPAFDHRGERKSREGFKQDMNVIRHDAPCQQPISNAVEMPQSGLDSAGDVRPVQPTGTEPSIELQVDIGLLGTHSCNDRLGKAIDQSERDRLQRLLSVEVGQIPSAVPATMGGMLHSFWQEEYAIHDCKTSSISNL